MLVSVRKLIEMIFRHDNDTKHTSKSNKNGFTRIRLRFWPERRPESDRTSVG